MPFPKLLFAGLAAATLLTACSSEESAPERTAEIEAPAAVETKQPGPAPAMEPAPERPLKEQEIVKTAVAELSPEARLGARLFFDNRLSNPGANLATNCRSCHVPPSASRGERRWADTTALSVMPASDRGSKLETLRNTPTLQDVVAGGPYPLDGAFETLDAYLVHKLTSDHMGWRPGEADQAKREFQALLMNDDGSDPLAEGTYLDHFAAVKGIDVLALSEDEAIDTIVASLQDYLATVVTSNSAAYDAMMFLNRFPEGLAGAGDTPSDYSGRFFGRVANEEGRVLIRFPNIYNEQAYQGLKTFMRVMPTWNSSVIGEETNIGNCVACHVPPKFSDHKFHNMGVSQMEYDAVHGEGSFMNLPVDAPSESTKARVDSGDPAMVDLGRWNVDPSDANLGAFKTPPLRDNAGTDPYMHNGKFATLEDAIRQHIRAADLARDGKLRNPDPELLKISGLSDEDVRNLVAFLETLNEVEPEEFRNFRIDNVRIRQDPLGESTFSN